MGQHFLNKILLIILNLILVGCDENTSQIVTYCSNAEANEVASRANSQKGDDQIRTFTAEELCALEMRKRLDEGDIQKSMMLARGLMDSSDPAIRSQVVGVFSWIGRKAIAELSEMLSDENCDVAQEALRGWEIAVEEFSYDEIKIKRIEEAIKFVSTADVARSILMKFSDFENALSLPALERIIINNRGKLISSTAKEMYEHLAGESWVSPERTRFILREQKEERKADESRKQVQ